MIQLKNIEKNYDKEKVIFEKLTINFNSAGFYFITGESGTGKTTLLNIISLIDQDVKGEIFYDNYKISELTPKEIDLIRNRYISYQTQDLNLVLDQTVYQNLKFILEMNLKKNFTFIKKILIELGLKDYENRNINELSKGELQRVIIASLLLKDTPILILDEPNSALDEESSEMVFKLLKKLSKKKIIIISSHDKTLVKKYAHYILDLNYCNFKKCNQEIELEKVSVENLKNSKNKSDISFYFKHIFSGSKIPYLIYFISILLFSMFLSFNYQKYVYPLGEKNLKHLDNDKIEYFSTPYKNDKNYENLFEINLTEINYKTLATCEIEENFLVSKNILYIGKMVSNFDEVIVTTDYIDKRYSEKQFQKILDYSDILNQEIAFNDKISLKIVGIMDLGRDKNNLLNYYHSLNEVLFVKKGFLDKVKKEVQISFFYAETEFDFINDPYTIVSRTLSTGFELEDVIFFDKNKKTLKENEILVSIKHFDPLFMNNEYVDLFKVLENLMEGKFTEDVQIQLEKKTGKNDVTLQDYFLYILSNKSNEIQPKYTEKYLKDVAELYKFNREKYELTRNLYTNIKNLAGGIYENKSLEIVGIHVNRVIGYETFLSEEKYKELLDLEIDQEYNGRTSYLYLLNQNKTEDILFFNEYKDFLNYKNELFQYRLHEGFYFQDFMIFSLLFLGINLSFFVLNFKLKNTRILILRNNGIGKKKILKLLSLEIALILSLSFLIVGSLEYKINLFHYRNIKSLEGFEDLIFHFDKWIYLILAIVLLGSYFIGILISCMFLLKKIAIENKKII